MILGVDVGGTFTDACAWDGQRLTVAKAPSTPDQSDGVVGVAAALGEQFTTFVHGTTVATNALLERRGAETVLVADEGLEDVLAIGRQDRPSLYDPFADRTPPIASRRIGTSIGFRGGIDERRLADLVAEVEATRPEAVAVSLLYAFLDPAPERAVGAALAPLGVPVSLSSEVANEFREYERTSTTVLNAFLTPEMDRYLGHLGDRASAAGLGSDVLVMRSSGGPMPLAAARSLPVAALLSGPAGGVVAAASLGSVLGDAHLVSFDMGGTSTDVCRIDGGVPEVGYERWIDGHAVRVPSVAIHTVGAGGGSVAWVDAGGALRVGPRSAGATPGPAAYGRGGTEPTVTDANVVLGRIRPDARLAGDVVLDPDRATAALADLGRRIGLDAVGVAEGIVEVVESHMERAVRVVSVEQGSDPRNARLVAFGGAGGLHASALARRLEMAGVVIAPYAGVFSALGLLLAAPRHDAARSVAATADLATVAAEVADEARRGLEHLGGVARTVETFVDVRYLGQAHETTVPWTPADGTARLAAAFHARHLERNGFNRPDDEIEVVTVRAVAVATPALTWDDLPDHRPAGPSSLGSGPVRLDGRSREVPFLRRAGLAPGTEIVGPAVLVDGEATALIGTGERGVVHATGAVEVEW